MKTNFVYIAFAIFTTAGCAGAQHASAANAASARVQVRENQLVVDGQNQPQLFGAEIQYFRMRGGYGRNIPREKVIALWNKALDRAVEAKMNTVSFYIPWDFHEYAEGQFDFNGTADEDGDGRPDYPSRDLITFFKLIEQHGIKRIMVRPGPYINAEWGFLGFGAIPSWFHKKFPESHTKTPWGWNKPLYDYANPQLLEYTKRWFKAVYENIIRDRVGAGQPIVFVQLDNETNYQWQSLYSSDYSPSTVQRYQAFLQKEYADVSAMNRSHNRTWSNFNEAQPPQKPGVNVAEDQDWYRFCDNTIFEFLRNVRRTWEGLNVTEPQVLFTLAESYNAPGHGLLPNYILRNARNETGLMTVNLYPKTFNPPTNDLHNSPFKADLDVKSAEAANVNYFGERQEWVLGPEIQGGWWRSTPVSPEARQQTYLTVIGHGMKAMYVYYYNEGQNWDVEWGKEHIQPMFEDLRKEWKVENLPVDKLSNEFWGELQARFDRAETIGFDVRWLMTHDLTERETLFFDAPLDENVNPRGHFKQLALIGQRVVAPYQNFLARATGVTDEVALLKDSASHVPSPLVDALAANTDWSGGMLGYLLNADINPKILHGELSPDKEMSGLKAIVHLDTGVNHPRTMELLRKALGEGRSVMNFIANQASCALGVCPAATAVTTPEKERAPLEFYVNAQGQFTVKEAKGARRMTMKSVGPLFTYEMSSVKNCQSILYYQGQTVGFRCISGQGPITQIGALFFADYNLGEYGRMRDPLVRKTFMKALLKTAWVQPKIEWSWKAERAVAFARKDPKREMLWITVKTATKKAQNLKIKLSESLVNETLQASPSNRFRVKNLLTLQAEMVSRAQLVKSGFSARLASEGSTVYVIEPVR